MAQVHPSRAAFIPQNDSKQGFKDRDSRRDRDYTGKSRGRSRSRSPPPRRSPSPNRRHEGPKERRKEYSPDRRDTKWSNGQRHDRSRTPPNRSQRSRSRDGRNSPSYEAYRQRKASGEQDNGLVGQPQNNWQRNYQQGSGYTAGPNSGGQRAFRNDAGAGGSVFFEERRRRRDAMTLNVWPPSPKAPARSLSPDGHRHRDKYSSKDKGRDKGKSKDKRRDKGDSRKKRKRSRSPSVSSEADSSEEERRREKRRRRDKEQRSRSREHRSRRQSTSLASPQNPVSGVATDEMEAESLWIEKKPVANAMPPPPVPASAAATLAISAEMNEDDDEIGPMPPQKSKDRIDEREYGGALLRGEGSAMAAFLQDNARIPRRGEIGLTSDEIAQYEDVGYVMSGSRHRRMNAVRMRKENQVISAEEKRGILKLQKEERERREELLKAEFRELVDEQLGNIGAARK